MTDCLDSINALTGRIGSQFNERSAQIKASHGAPEKAKIYMRRSASDMADYSRALSDQLEIYSKAKVESFDALSKALSLHREIVGKDHQVVRLQSSLRQMLSAIENSRSGIREMRDSAARFPRMIKEVNISRRTMVGTLDRFLAEIDSTHTTASNIIDSIDLMT
jgi:hypothetical protein